MEPKHRTTARILDIFELVAAHPEGVSLASISQRLSIPKSSLHPLLLTLTDRHYLYHKAKEERYYLGESLFVVGNKYVNDANILSEIRNIVFEISKELGETLYFGVLSDLDVLYLIKADLYSQFRVVSIPGNKLPAYSTGYGKALLSQFGPEEIRSFYPNGKLKPVTDRTIGDTDELNRQLEEIRRCGFSFEKGESTEGIQCVGVRIENSGEVLAGLSVAVPEFRYTEEREKLFKKALKKAKHKIEQVIEQRRSQWIYSGEAER